MHVDGPVPVPVPVLGRWGREITRSGRGCGNAGWTAALERGESETREGELAYLSESSVIALKGLSENVPGFDNSATSQPTSAHMDAILAQTARL